MIQRQTTPPDEYGNHLIIIYGYDLKVIRKTIELRLKLATDNRSRLIGTIILKDKTLYIIRDRNKHLFKKNNSYGFNYYILKNAGTFEFINFNDGVIKAIIPVKYILENGEFLFFKNQGYEKQIFITLGQIEQFKTKQNDNYIKNDGLPVFNKQN